MNQIKNKILKTDLVNWQELKDLQPTNLKNPYHNEKTKKSLIKNGFSFAFYVWESEDGIYLLDGHLRTDLLRELVNEGFEVPDQLTCTFLDLKNRKEAVKYLLEVFNTKKNPIDEVAMLDWFEIEEIKVEEVEVESLDVERVEGGEVEELAPEEGQDETQTLVDKFIIPPFSIFDTRQGYWQERKLKWLNLGIKSEKGRDDNLMKNPDLKYGTWKGMGASVTTSIFDPVVCDVCYQWFTPHKKAKILDPFAGGSVRGIVASKLGYEYYGCDLRDEQIIENRRQGLEICDEDKQPIWVADDSQNIKTHFGEQKYDLIFSCPPYADLEVYSQDQRDISNMEYEQFLEIYSKIIKNSLDLLHDDRFAIFVVGDVRDKKGFYYDFISDTKKIFIENGAKLYNEIILLEMAGTAAMRAEKTFTAKRKTIKMNQNVLVFYKGDP